LDHFDRESRKIGLEESKEDSRDGRSHHDEHIETDPEEEQLKTEATNPEVELPLFHIAIDGPADSTFPSFRSSELSGGDPMQITLRMIRERCSM
jgi:hypothetical protein